MAQIDSESLKDTIVEQIIQWKERKLANLDTARDAVNEVDITADPEEAVKSINSLMKDVAREEGYFFGDNEGDQLIGVYKRIDGIVRKARLR